jgi:hypothetical protein
MSLYSSFSYMSAPLASQVKVRDQQGQRPAELARATGQKHLARLLKELETFDVWPSVEDAVLRGKTAVLRFLLSRARSEDGHASGEHGLGGLYVP